MKKDIIPRPPVVAILGHVDHGKTSLLDFIRKSKIADREAGGITQKIGAYELTTQFKEYKSNKITFIDTPGHEAFSLLRARGANISDIAVLVIDAKDGIMPQTSESISHIKNAKIPYIVAINKIDLPDANPDKIKNDLLKYEVLVEGKGGSIPVVPLSAKTGQGVQDLLETILFLASDSQINYSITNPLKAYVIETKKDKRGIVISAIIKDGQLQIGTKINASDITAKVRALIDDIGAPQKTVTPSMPFEILGFDQLPELGSLITDASSTEQPIKKSVVPAEETASSKTSEFTLESILHPAVKEKKLSVVIKTDSQGTLEAIYNYLSKNNQIEIILKAVGDIHRSDIFLAKTSKAIVIGFDVNVADEVRQLAKQEKVIIKNYSIIYELFDELSEVTDLLQEKKEQERNLKGEAKVLANFIIEQEKVIGVKIVKGKINLGDNLEIYRQNNLIGKSKLVSLKIRAKRVDEVKKQEESGMVLSPPLDIRVGDVIKSIL